MIRGRISLVLRLSINNRLAAGWRRSIRWETEQVTNLEQTFEITKLLSLFRTTTYDDI